MPFDAAQTHTPQNAIPLPYKDRHSTEASGGSYHGEFLFTHNTGVPINTSQHSLTDNKSPHVYVASYPDPLPFAMAAIL